MCTPDNHSSSLVKFKRSKTVNVKKFPLFNFFEHKLSISSWTYCDNCRHYNIVSTASRVLNATEQRYSTCERELLAIVYALDRFKIYIYGHKITLCTDNKALTFFNKCVITTNRVARWILNIQEYDIKIKYIKGVQNHFADILSRNPTGLTDEEITNLTRPDQILVYSFQLYTDRAIR